MTIQFRSTLLPSVALTLAVFAAPLAQAKLFHPAPVLQITGIELSGKPVTQLAPQDMLVLPQRAATPVTLVVGGSITRGMTVKVPKDAALTLQSANGVTIRMEPNSELYVDAVIGDGEAYAVARGEARFDLAKKLGFFNVKHGAISAWLQPTQAAQFNVAVVDNKKNVRFTVVRGALAVDEPVAYTDVDKSLTVVGFETAGVTDGQARVVSDAAKARKKVSFANFEAAQDNFKSAIKVATDPLRQQDLMRQAAMVARKFKRVSESLEYHTMWREAAVTSGTDNKLLRLENALETANACYTAKIANCAVTQFEDVIATAEALYADGLQGSLIAARMGLAAQQKAVDATAPLESFTALTEQIRSRAGGDYDMYPKMTKRAEIKYPRLMQVNGLEADALIEFKVLATGDIEAVKVLQSSHPEFEKVVLKSVLESTFAPAMRDGNAVPSRVVIPYGFRLDPVDKDKSLAFVFSKEPNPKLPASLQYDKPPVVKLVTPVIYPRQLLLDGVAGSATVTVTMDSKGMVREVDVLEATHPDFGAVTKAMMQTWEFFPAMKDEEAIPNIFVYTQKFSRKLHEAGFDKHARNVLYELGSKNSDIVEMSALDTRPKALYQPSSFDPQPLKPGTSQAESVVVEFFIDPEGAVQLPRIVSATDMERGWAAATAVKRWLFEVPKVKGKAVYARRELAFMFN